MVAKAKKKHPEAKKKVQLRPTKIRLWREYREMTLEETAARMGEYLRHQGVKKGYTHNSLGRLERGEFQYKQQVIEAAAFALKIDEGSLISRDPPPKGQPIPVWVDVERAPEPVRAQIEDHIAVVLKRAGIR